MSPSLNHRILVIDDTASIHADFRRILSAPDAAPELDAAEEALFGEVSQPTGSGGFDLDFAAQGREGLEKVQASLEVDRPYALAFVDMRMPPGWDGVETIREIWKVDPRLQVVICTAHSDYTWDEVLGALGVEDRLLVLKKPFDNIEVAQLASTLTAKWDMTRLAEQKVSLLEAAVEERTDALSVANAELQNLVRDAIRQATHDALTGLPNRLLFADRAIQALAAARRSGALPVVLMVDLDRFKEVNDALGHQNGDLLLCQVAERLTEVLRETDTVARFGTDGSVVSDGDTVARFGGDEFVLLLTDGGAAAGARIATRIALALEVPFLLGETTVGVEASIGIADSTALEEPTLDGLLRQADMAMYKAKTDRSGFAHFAACSDDGTLDRLTLIGELRQALDHAELVLFYQPKIDIDTGELVGVEALVRWQHPTRGLLLPGEFIAIALGSTLIHRLTTTVVDQALLFCRGWLDQGVRLPVAVNVSTRNLYNPDFPTTIANALARAQVPAELLTIELTEGSIMTYPDVAQRILQQLCEMGVLLSVDDYGTGYSSLSYLKHLPVHELKIDQSFVAGMTGNPQDAIIVQSAIDLGHDLGMSVVAEGIENTATFTALKSLGVDIAQGFHIGRPMPETLLRQWIADRGTRTSKQDIETTIGV
jgi:predicted signal transduction protein with EAL and GGDEF domain